MKQFDILEGLQSSLILLEKELKTQIIDVVFLVEIFSVTNV